MIASICLGLIVGVISVLTGLGGGVVMVPLLPLLTGADQKQAIATSLFVVFLNGAQITFFSVRKKNLDIKFALPIAVIGIMTAYFASILIYRFTNYNLRVFLCVVMAFIIFILVRPPKFTFHRGKNIFRYAVGAIAGFVSGLSGLGGGIVVGPLLLAGKAISHQALPSTITFVSMCFAGVATLTHLVLNVPTMTSWGPILWKEAILVFIPAVFVTKALFPLQQKLTENQRRYLLLLFSIVLFLKSLVSIL